MGVAGTVVVVVDVRLMHVFTDGIIGMGIVGATHGCGLAITPHAAFFLSNSSSHSVIAFFKACRGWYMFGDNVDGTSSPRTPSSVSVSSLMSADTASSMKYKRLEEIRIETRKFDKFNHNVKYDVLKVKSLLPSMLHLLH